MRTFMKVLIWLQTLSSLAIAQAVEQNDLSLADILNLKVEIASTTAESVFTTPSTVTVIDRDMLTKYNFQTVGQALEHATGVQVLRTYLLKELPTVRGVLQNQYANKVLVMINKIPLWNAVTGEGSLDRIPIDMVERIEILRGPASVLYGSNAYVGAINIVTRHSESVGKGKALAGEYGLFQGSFFLSEKNPEGWNYLVGGEGLASDGKMTPWQDETGTQTRYRDYNSEKNLTLRLNNGGHTITFNTYGSEFGFIGLTTQFRQGGGFPHFVRGQALSYQYDSKLSDKLTLQVTALYDHGYRRFTRGPNVTVDSGANQWVQSIMSDIEGYRARATGTLNYKMSDAITLSGGLDYEYRHSISYNTYNDQNMINTTDSGMNGALDTESSAFVQGEYKVGSYGFLLGSRYTSNQLSGSNISSRLTTVYSLTSNQSLKLIIGQSFRSPTLYELFFSPTGVTNYGNRGLQPETSESIELAYLLSMGSFYSQLLVYQANYQNLITRVSYAAGPAGSTINVNAANPIIAYGVELDLKYEKDNVKGFLNASYQTGNDGDRDSTNLYNFYFVPLVQGTVGVSVDINKQWWVSVPLRYTATMGTAASNIPESYEPDLNVGYSSKYKNNKLTQILSLKNIGSESQIPEYNRRMPLSSTVPYGNVQTASYSLGYEF